MTERRTGNRAPAKAAPGRYVRSYNRPLDQAPSHHEAAPGAWMPRADRRTGGRLPTLDEQEHGASTRQ